jgi:hypothetical protein
MEEALEWLDKHGRTATKEDLIQQKEKLSEKLRRLYDHEGVYINSWHDEL